MELYYFGCGNHGLGHHWYVPGWSGHYDGPCPHSVLGRGVDGLLAPRPERLGVVSQGFVHGHTYLAWWDRSVDTRGGCNSVLAAKGKHTARSMFAQAKESFPGLMERQKVPLIVIEEGMLFEIPSCDGGEIEGLNQYQDLADRTMNRTMPTRDQMINGVLGLAGESGEVSEIVKKHLFHSHDLDAEGVKKELGDVLWYVATLAKTLGLSLEDIAQANIDKLRSRYPDGFDCERSKERAA